MRLFHADANGGAPTAAAQLRGAAAAAASAAGLGHNVLFYNTRRATVAERTHCWSLDG